MRIVKAVDVTANRFPACHRVWKLVRQINSDLIVLKTGSTTALQSHLARCQGDLMAEMPKRGSRETPHS